MPFKNLNINFTSFYNFQYYLFSSNNNHSIINLEQRKNYDAHFYDALKNKVIYLLEDILNIQIDENNKNNINDEQIKNGTTSEINDIYENKHTQNEIKKSEDKNSYNSSHIYSNADQKNLSSINKNKLIKIKTQKFCKENYFFHINKYFLKSLRKYNFQISKNQKNNHIYIPKTNIKILIQANYNLYMFMSNMIFDNVNKEEKYESFIGGNIPDESSYDINNHNIHNKHNHNICNNDNYHISAGSKIFNKNIEHIELLLNFKLKKKIDNQCYIGNIKKKKKKKHYKKDTRRLKKLCVQYEEKLDLFIYSAFTQNLYIDEIILQLSIEKEYKKKNIMYVHFKNENDHCDKYIVKEGLNHIKLNIINLLESKKISWKHFHYKVKYVFLVINNFALYHKIGVIPNKNLIQPFIKSYSKFIISNFIVIDHNKSNKNNIINTTTLGSNHCLYSNFFIDQLLSPLYIKIETLNSILNCKMLACFLNSTSLICDNINYIKLVINNNYNINYNNNNNLYQNQFLFSNTNMYHIENEDHKFIPNDFFKKNIHILINKMDEDPNYYKNEFFTSTDSILFYIEKNEEDNICIDQIKILNEDDINHLNEKNKNIHSVPGFSNNNYINHIDHSNYFLWNNQAYFNEYKQLLNHKNFEKVYAIISFMPSKKKKMNHYNVHDYLGKNKNIEHLTGQYEQINDNSTGTQNNNNISTLHTNHNNINNLYSIPNLCSDKITIKCIININLSNIRRKVRKTDTVKLLNVHFMGEIVFDHFNTHYDDKHVREDINEPKNEDNISSELYLNNQIFLEKTFNLVNIFHDRINTYRSKNGMMYELVMKLHNDNYPIYLKNLHVSILKNLNTHIKNTKIFFLNKNNDQKKYQTTYSIENQKMDIEHSDESNFTLCSEMESKEKVISFENHDISFVEQDNYFIDQVHINTVLKGGASIFFLFEVYYNNDIQNNDSSINYRDYQNTIGNIHITYVYKNETILKLLEKETIKEYMYKFHTLIPQFLLPINVSYNIPKTGMLHSNININISISNNINEDIYMKYYINTHNNHMHNSENQYNWLINGFQKKIIHISKNSSYNINLTITPLKVGLINFPPISYFLNINNNWIDITKILKKSENFQVIVSPSLQFTPKVWQIM